MRVAILGGAGRVSSMVTPYLKERHELRIVDLKSPADPSLDYRAVDVANCHQLSEALEGMQALIYALMPRLESGAYDTIGVDSNYDYHVKHLHRALEAARMHRMSRVVYVSSLSVYDSLPQSDDAPWDARDIYGLCKYLGEQVCAFFNRVHHLPILSLRLGNPISDAEWQESYRNGYFSGQTAELDVARALDLALTSTTQEFHTIPIAGDWLHPSLRATQILGWEPLTRPRI